MSSVKAVQGASLGCFSSYDFSLNIPFLVCSEYIKWLSSFLKHINKWSNYLISKQRLSCIINKATSRGKLHSCYIFSKILWQHSLPWPILKFHIFVKPFSVCLGFWIPVATDFPPTTQEVIHLGTGRDCRLFHNCRTCSWQDHWWWNFETCLRFEL